MLLITRLHLDGLFKHWTKQHTLIISIAFVTLLQGWRFSEVCQLCILVLTLSAMFRGSSLGVVLPLG